MDDRPFFSILICTVGKEELTRGAIDSILGQTVQDFEIVVTDTSGEGHIRTMAESYRDPRIRYFDVPDQDPTLGWEFAFRQSHGKYVMWYDDDNRLVPWALERYKKLIDEGADIASANHAYYFGPGTRHTVDAENGNVLTALLPFSCKEKEYDPDQVLHAIYDLSIGRAVMPARWHSAATFVSREICEKAEATVGYIIAPHMYGNYTFHPLIFTYAKHPVYDDRPMCIIGKFASSLTQQWSDTKKIKRTYARPFQYTGLSIRTLGNTTAECYLQVRHDLPAHEKYPFNWEKLYYRYSTELIYLKVSFIKLCKALLELWKATARLDAHPRRTMRLRMVKQFAQSIGLHFLRSIGVWEVLRPLLTRKLFAPENRTAVSLNQYDVHTIDECAEKLDTIMQKAFGIAIRPLERQ